MLTVKNLGKNSVLIVCKILYKSLLDEATAEDFLFGAKGVTAWFTL